MGTDHEIVQYLHGINVCILVHRINHYKFHWHKEMELILVLKGSVFVTLEGKKYPLQEDDLFLINSGEIHGTLGNGDNILAVLQINPDFCSANFPGLERRFFEWNIHALPEEPVLRLMRFFIATIVEEYRRVEQGYQLAIEGLLNSLIALMVRSLPMRNQPSSALDAVDQTNRDRVKRITDYIQEHFTEKITLGDLAKDVAYVNPYYLSHFFREKIGVSFLEYLNMVRLKHAVNLLSSKQQRIGDIALDCGFGNIKAFNGAFKKHYGVTPQEYRKNNDFLSLAVEQSAYLKFDSLVVLEKLQIYTKYFTDIQPLVGSVRTGVEEILFFPVEIPPEPCRSPLFPRWRRLAAVGRAYDLLRGDLRKQVEEAVRELGISHVRFHGIFNDEMRILTRNEAGKLRFNWTYVDALFDFLVSAGVSPIVDCTFMPGALKSGDKTIFWYQGNITPPQDLREWSALIRNFAVHCIERYGLETVRNWYFEVWNEPEMLWAGTAKEYYNLYKATTRALKEIDSSLKIAGPSALHSMTDVETDDWIAAFIDFCNRDDLPLDCFTFHFYGEQRWTRLGKDHYVARFGDQDSFARTVMRYRKELSRFKGAAPEILITEFNLSARHGNYLLDTMFTACHLLYNFLKNHDEVNGIALWTLSDIFEEDDEPTPPFGGGFGLVTTQGIRKPGWWALWFLRRLEGDIIAKGDEYCVTQREDTVTILAFRYVFFDNFFKQGDYSRLTYEFRYECFEQKPPAQFVFALPFLAGSWEEREYTLDREHGSAFDLFVKMGMPQNPSREDTAYLLALSRPSLTVRQRSFNGDARIEFSIPPQGVKMVQLRKIGP